MPLNTMNRIILIDNEPVRAEFVRSLFERNNLSAAVSFDLNQIDEKESMKFRGIALIHWSMIDRAYSMLAQLHSHGGIKMLFYCLCPEMRVREKILLLPQELETLISRISPLQAIESREL
jgi:hypothetical protein